MSQLHRPLLDPAPAVDQSAGSLPPRRPLEAAMPDVSSGPPATEPAAPVASQPVEQAAPKSNEVLSLEDFEPSSASSSAAPARSDSAPDPSVSAPRTPGNTESAATAPASSDSASEAARRANEVSERAAALPPESARASAPTAPAAPATSESANVTQQQSTELTPYEQQLLNKMSKDAREYVVARFTENKQLAAEVKQAKTQLEEYHKNVLPASYYQNPDAYTLSPEYKSAAVDLQYASYEEQHWTQQAMRMRAGEDVVYDLAYDNNGQPRLTEVKVTPETAPHIEVQLQKNLAASMHAKQRESARVQNIAATYTQRYTQANENLNKLNAQYFKAYMDPKSPRASDIANFKQFLPAEFREHPLTAPLAYSYAMVQDLLAKIKQLEGASQVKASIAADQAKAGPVVAAASSAAAAPQKLSMAMFED